MKPLDCNRSAIAAAPRKQAQWFDPMDPRIRAIARAREIQSITARLGERALQ